MKRRFIALAGALMICLLVLTADRAPVRSAVPTNWPQWRGPGSQGISPEKNLPTEWSETKNIQWKTPIPGNSLSSPIIWEKKIFLTSAIEGPALGEDKAVKHVIGKDKDGNEKLFTHPDWYGSDHSHTMKVFCVDRDTGKILWDKTAYEGPVYDHRHKRGSYASPTPVTDGKYVWAFFGSEGLYCYDFNGKLIWKTSLGGIPTLGMGVGTSPVLYENLVILQCDHDIGQGSFIIGLDKTTGKEVWRTPRKVQASWATPLLVKTAQRAELIASGNELIISYDPATGKEWWRCKGLASHAIATPVTTRDLVIISSGFPSKRIIAIRLGGSGDLTDTPSIIWTYAKGTAYVPSPILYQDLLYLMNDQGVFTCLDPLTGEVKYEGGRLPTPAQFYGGSPVAFDGKILITSDDGETFVIKAGLQHEVLRTNSLGEVVRTSIAIADGKLFIRGEKNLYCIKGANGGS